jgi:hypothetical protein
MVLSKNACLIIVAGDSDCLKISQKEKNAE